MNKEEKELTKNSDKICQAIELLVDANRYTAHKAYKHFGVDNRSAFVQEFCVVKFWASRRAGNSTAAMKFLSAPKRSGEFWVVCGKSSVIELDRRILIKLIDKKKIYKIGCNFIGLRDGGTILFLNEMDLSSGRFCSNTTLLQLSGIVLEDCCMDSKEKDGLYTFVGQHLSKNSIPIIIECGC